MWRCFYLIIDSNSLNKNKYIGDNYETGGLMIEIINNLLMGIVLQAIVALKAG